MVGCTGPTALVDWFDHDLKAILIRSKDLSVEEVRKLDAQHGVAQIVNLRTDPYDQERVDALEEMGIEVHHYHSPISVRSCLRIRKIPSKW